MKFTLAILTFFTLISCKATSSTNKDKIVLSKETTLVLSDEVSSQSVSKLLLQAKQLDEFLDDGQPLYLVLNTPGGSISDGMELIEGLNSLDRPVHTITIFAASMGFQIAQGLKTRYILKTGELMSHKASTGKGGFGGEFGGKEPSQLTSRYNSWIKKIREMDLQTVKRTKGKQTLESYLDAYENEMWISGQDAVNSGYADKVTQVKCDMTLNGTKTLDYEFFGMIIKLVVSECPTITGILDVYAVIQTNKGPMVLKDFKAKGGNFGGICTVAKQAKMDYMLCPEDVTLTEDRILQNINNIKQQVTKKSVIYMSY